MKETKNLFEGLVFADVDEHFSKIEEEKKKRVVEDLEKLLEVRKLLELKTKENND